MKPGDRMLRELTVTPSKHIPTVFLPNGDVSARSIAYRMFGFMREMRAAICHLRDARIRVVRMRPVVIAPFLEALAIEARQICASSIVASIAIVCRGPGRHRPGSAEPR